MDLSSKSAKFGADKNYLDLLPIQRLFGKLTQFFYYIKKSLLASILMYYFFLKTSWFFQYPPPLGEKMTYLKKQQNYWLLCLSKHQNLKNHLKSAFQYILLSCVQEKICCRASKTIWSPATQIRNVFAKVHCTVCYTKLSSKHFPMLLKKPSNQENSKILQNMPKKLFCKEKEKNWPSKSPRSNKKYKPIFV